MAITEEKLTELEALCEAATPGPWSWEDQWGTCEWWLRSGTLEQIEADDIAVSIVLSIEGRRLCIDNEDRALIAEAPTATPALIAEVRQLTTDARRYRRERDLIQAECDRLRLLNEMISKDEIRIGLARDEAEAEVKALRAENKYFHSLTDIVTGAD